MAHDICDGRKIEDVNIMVYGEDVSYTNPFPVATYNSIVPETYDYIALTYVASGNGEGEIETVTYKEGGAGGTTQATLTLTYDSSNRIATVAKT